MTLLLERFAHPRPALAANLAFAIQ